MIPHDLDSVLPATMVKRHFLKLLKKLGPERSAITITRNGLPAGVLMSVEEYEGLVETVEILADPRVRKALGRARKNFVSGRTLRHTDVWPEE